MEKQEKNNRIDLEQKKTNDLEQYRISNNELEEKERNMKKYKDLKERKKKETGRSWPNKENIRSQETRKEIYME